jgi:hypothetical protein
MISAPHPIEAEELMAYLDGELAADRAAVAADHLDECAECRRLVEDLRNVSRRLVAWEVEACGVRVVEGRVVRPWWARKTVWAAGLAAGMMMVGVRARYSSQHAAIAVDLVKTKAPTAFRTVVPGSIYNSESHFVFDSPGPVSLADLGTRLKVTFNTASSGVRINQLPLIAHTAQLAVVAKDFTIVRERLEAIVKSHHGYIGQITVNSPADDGRTLDAALKVPSTELDASLAEVKKLGKVETESQTGDDVTKQYIDLEARLANSRNAEQRLAAILRQQTGKLTDVLAVEKEITRVRGEIEQMEAEHKDLSRRVEFATINVKVTEEYKAQLQGPDSVGTRLGNAAVAGYRNVTGGLLGVAEFLLEYGLSVLLGGVLLFVPARLVWRRYRAGAPTAP